eukprot:gnl/MRDRNA2_/MRDRNA2_74507_c0_seq1.p1 gnl/MRDRNA2_/MRDRNA2_74507_c0~~gnl/MRDRNA2_/MRDRNA2_74507_c0_seq1.p1  ORF type:complete len:1343 (-),score=220.56 gnl/MRDRNA2_/MRDRNA2_74507_c0_seq1:5-4033(-)
MFGCLYLLICLHSVSSQYYYSYADSNTTSGAGASMSQGTSNATSGTTGTSGGTAMGQSSSGDTSMGGGTGAMKMQEEKLYTDSYCKAFSIKICIGVEARFEIIQPQPSQFESSKSGSTSQQESYSYGSASSPWNELYEHEVQHNAAEDSDSSQSEDPLASKMEAADITPSPAVGDVNRDGYLDAIVGFRNGSLMFWKGSEGDLLRDNSGAFYLASVGSTFAKPALVDMDSDGFIDHVAVGVREGTVMLFTLRPDGTLTNITGSNDDPFRHVDVGSNAAPTAGDIDFDNVTDFLIGNADGEIWSFKGHARDGPQVSEIEQWIGKDYDPFSDVYLGDYASPCLADVNQDGILDVVVGDSDNSLLWFFQGQPSGGFNLGDAIRSSRVSSTDNPFSKASLGGVGFMSPAVGDFDRDGQNDVLVANKMGWAALLKSDIPRTFKPWSGAYMNPVSYANVSYDQEIYSWTIPALADMDGDGIYDILSGNDNGLIKYLRGYRNSLGRIAMERMTGADNPFDGVNMRNGTRIALGDIDSDGYLDAIIANVFGEMEYYRGSSSGRFTKITDKVSDLIENADLVQDEDRFGYWPYISLGDLDGDGIVDGIVSHACDGDFDALHDSVRNGFVEHDSFWYLRGQSNGKFTIVENGYQVLFGTDANGMFQPSQKPFTAFASTIGDVNGDGLNDLVGVTNGMGLIYLSEITSSGRTYTLSASYIEFTDPRAFPTPALGDVNKDGVPDIVLGNRDGGLEFYTLGEQCVTDCSGSGRCSSELGECECLRKHTGMNCERCDVDHYAAKSEFGDAPECVPCPTNSATGQICSGRGVCDDQDNARKKHGWLAWGDGVCVCSNDKYTGGKCEIGSCGKGWGQVLTTMAISEVKTCEICGENYAQGEDADASCTHCPFGEFTFGKTGQESCTILWPYVLVFLFVFGMFLVWAIKRIIVFHNWRMEQERRKEGHLTHSKTCNELNETLNNRKLKDHFPRFFDVPMKLKAAEPLNAGLKDYVGMLISNSVQEKKYRWNPEEAEMTRQMIRATQNYIARYLELSEQWSDEDLNEIANSGVAVKYEEAYDSVHNLIREDAAYNNLEAAVEECKKKKVTYNDWIDRIAEVGERIVTLYERAARVRYAYFDELMNHIGQEVGVKANLAPLKGLFRVLEKVVMRPHSGVPWDIIRGQLICTSMDELNKVLSLLAAHKHVKFLGVNNRFAKPAKGWADVGIYMIFDIKDYDCVVCEVQVVHENMMLVREQMGAHDSYDNSRLAQELLNIRKHQVSPTKIPVLPVKAETPCHSEKSASVVVPIPPEEAEVTKKETKDKTDEEAGSSQDIAIHGLPGQANTDTPREGKKELLTV